MGAGQGAFCRSPKFSVISKLPTHHLFKYGKLPASAWTPVPYKVAWRLSRWAWRAPLIGLSSIKNCCPVLSGVQLFHIFCLVSSCLRWESKSCPCYFILAQSGSQVMHLFYSQIYEMSPFQTEYRKLSH